MRGLFGFLAATALMTTFAATPVSAFSFQCEGAHPYLNGFSVRWGQLIDQIKPICHSFSSDGKVSGSRIGPAFGGETGGGPRIETCPADSVLVAARIYVTGAFGGGPSYVRAVTLICRSLTSLSSSEICLGVCSNEAKSAQASTCPGGQVVTGVRGGSRKFVESLGLICGPAPKVAAAPPPPVATTPAQPQRTGTPLESTGGRPGSTGGGASKQEAMDCRGGGGMTVTPLNEGKSVYVTFVPGGNVNRLRAGECAWVNRAFKQEGRRLALQLSADRAQELLDVARSGGSFTVRASPIGSSFIMVGSIANVRGDGSQSSPAPTPIPGGGGVASGSGPGGTATVVIPEPHLDRLNVRSEPNGAVIGAVPRGRRVSVIGPCGAAGGAGLRAGVRPVINTPGWCQIQSPAASGCVMTQYLQFGGGGGTQLPGGAAGVRRQR